MSGAIDPGQPSPALASRTAWVGLRMLVPLAWLLGTVGYHGAWIAHDTAALTLGGLDLGEFVKFLPGVIDGTVRIYRVLFYLPVVAVVASIALVAFSPRLGLSRGLRLLVLVAALALSLQVLPPAWSLATFTADEFRTQVAALIALWLALAGSAIWARTPVWLTFLACAVLSMAAMACSAWQFLVVKPHIQVVYGSEISTGWGFFVCQAGLVILAGASAAVGLLFVDDND